MDKTVREILHRSQNPHSQRWRKIGLGLLLAATLGSCRSFNSTDQLVEAASEAQFSEDIQLVFREITLEQGDNQGQLLWKIYAKEASYSEDRQIATVEAPAGELYQDGELVYQVEATRGEVHQDGNLILLKDGIKAIAVKDKVTLAGNRLEWRPQADILVVYNTLTGSHPQVQAKANQAKLYSRLRQMELVGKVEAQVNSPPLRMETEQLVWLMAQNKILGAVPITVKHYPGSEPEFPSSEATPSHTASGGGTVVDLQAKTVTLMNEATLTATNPPLQLESSSITWNVPLKSVGANQQVTLAHLGEQLTLVADRGTVDLEQQVAHLTANVRVTGGPNQSDLSADNVVWSFGQEEIEATGNVIYRQSDPPLFLQGARAFGNLLEQTMTVSSGDRTRTVTEITP